MSDPLLKWAGGKRKLIPVLEPLIRERLTGRYIEPFVGGGAVALHLGLPGMVLSDVNAELINLYRCVRDNYKELWLTLGMLGKMGINKENFYDVRASFPSDPVGVAVRTIYLNKTCHSGLYRVNNSGGFNVPFAHDKTGRDWTALFPSDAHMAAASQALRGATIYHQDFETTIAIAGPGDVVYADPPYDSTFDKYSKGGFSQDDQRRLRDSLEMAVARGAKILASNADTPFIRSLFGGFQIEATKEKRNFGDRKDAKCVLIRG